MHHACHCKLVWHFCRLNRGKYETRWWFEAFFDPRKFWGRFLQPFWMVHTFFLKWVTQLQPGFGWYFPGNFLAIILKCGRFRLWLMDFSKVGVRWWKVVNGDQLLLLLLLLLLWCWCISHSFSPSLGPHNLCWASKIGGKFHERYLAFRGSGHLFQAPKQIDLKWDEDWGISWWNPCLLLLDCGLGWMVPRATKAGLY